jgi:hypothetical protein
METPQPPQVSVSGRIVIEGHLPASSGATAENAPATPSPPGWKFWRRWPPETVSAISALATIILAVSTGIVALVSYCQLIDARSALVVANRAWIAPTGIWHDRQQAFVLGTAVNYVLLFRNIGKTPALHFNVNIENGFFPTPERRIDVPHTDFSRDDMCIGTNISDRGEVIFPDAGQPTYTSGEGFSLPALPLQSDTLEKGPKVKVTQQILDGTEALYVRGCITYSTMGIVGKSGFCFFINPYKSSDVKQPGSILSIPCSYGNSAE